MVDTVKTIKPSGGDYTSLSAWEAGQQKVIASGDTEQAECYAMSDTTAVTINGWTTASDAYIRIYTPASERHDGKWNTAKYRLEVAGTVLTVQEENVRLDGLQVFMTNTASSFLYGIILSGITGVADFRIENCLVRASDEIGANCNGVYLAAAGAGSVVRMKNTAVYGFYSTGDFDAALRGGTANITAYLYNCVFVRGNYGVLSNPGVFNCTNCYAGATDHGAYVIGGGSGGTINRTTSASSDATGSAGLQNIAYSTTAGAYFANITVGSEDFHIGASSALKDVGTDLSADANYAFTDDIDGQTRSGTWDIGADEIVAAAATTITKRRLRHVIYPVPGPYNPGQFQRRKGSAAIFGQTIAITDTGVGVDALAIAVGLAIADSGVGTDVGPAPAAAVPVGDTGAGSDAITLQVSVSVTDAASGVDVVSVLTALLLTVTDAASGNDAISIAVQAAVTDAGAGADQPSLAVSLSVADSVSAVDVVSVLMATLKTVLDAGTGVDAVSVSVSVPVGDAGSGLDAVAIAALLSVIDTGAGADIVLSFNAATRIATITFTLTERSVSFALSRRSISFDLH